MATGSLSDLNKLTDSKQGQTPDNVPAGLVSNGVRDYVYPHLGRAQPVMIDELKVPALIAAGTLAMAQLLQHGCGLGRCQTLNLVWLSSHWLCLDGSCLVCDRILPSCTSDLAAWFQSAIRLDDSNFMAGLRSWQWFSRSMV